MKRLIFVICALFVLCACTSSQVNTNVSIDEKVPVLFYYGLTEDGVFVNNTTGADIDDYRLDFFDFQNQKTYPFCTRSNCHHNSKDCQAYQMAHFENGTLFTVAAYKDYLYLIYEMSGDNGFDNVGFFIARCGMDGENIEKLFERKGGIQIPNYSYIYKDKIIYSYNTLSVTSMGGSTSTVGVLEMYDLDTKQITNIVNQDLQENRMNLFLGAKDDLIYFIDCDMTTMKKPVYSFDLKTQNKELVDENCPTDRSTLYQGHLYYADEENNKIISYDILTHEKKNEAELPEQEGTLYLSTKGGLVNLRYVSDQETYTYIYDVGNEEYILEKSSDWIDLDTKFNDGYIGTKNNIIGMFSDDLEFIPFVEIFT